MIPDNTAPENITPEQHEAVRRAVLDYIDASGKTMTRTKVAQAVGISLPTLSQVLNGRYPGNWQDIVLDLDRWLEQQIKRDAAPRVTSFVWTSIAQEIRTVAETACILKTIGLVYGPDTSGIGKTMTLETLTDIIPASIYVRVSKASSTPSGLFETIAKAMRLPMGSTHTRYLYKMVRDKLRDSNRLLMIDQIHSLCGVKDDASLLYLMDLYDDTGASPQLWCGTSDIISYLNRRIAKGREPLTQIDSRIGIQLDLMARTRNGHGGNGEPLFTIEDIRKVFAANKMRLDPGAARYLLELANLPDAGGLRVCTNLVVLATRSYEQDEKVLTADMLKTMHGALARSQHFTQLQSRMASHRPKGIALVG